MRTPSPQTSTDAAGTDPDSLLFRIVDEIAAVRGVEPTDVPPLQEHVDVDAIIGLVESTTAVHPGEMRLSFRVEELLVSVFGDGTVEVSSLVAESTGAETVAVE